MSKSTATNMNLNDFTSGTKSYLTAFMFHWNGLHNSNPEEYPMDLTLEQWNQEFGRYVQEQEKKF